MPITITGPLKDSDGRLVTGEVKFRPYPFSGGKGTGKVIGVTSMISGSTITVQFTDGEPDYDNDESAAELELYEGVYEVKHAGTILYRISVPSGTTTRSIAELVSAGVEGPPSVEIGMPAGGTTGQRLAKQSDDDYDADWQDESGGGGTTLGLINRTSSDGTVTAYTPSADTDLARGVSYAAAIAAAVAGDTIQLGAGIYDVGTGTIPDIPVGVHVRGAGRGATIICTQGTSGFQLESNSSLRELTVEAPVGSCITNLSGAYTGVIVENCELVAGDFGSAATVEDVSEYRFINCDFRNSAGVAALFLAYCNGAGGTMTILGGTVTSSVAGVGADIAASNGTLVLDGVRVVSASVIAISQSGSGVIQERDSYYDSAKVIGTITHLRDPHEQAGLDAKADTGHSHVIADVTGLQVAIDFRMANVLWDDYIAYNAVVSGATPTTYLKTNSGQLLVQYSSAAGVYRWQGNNTLTILNQSYYITHWDFPWVMEWRVENRSHGDASTVGLLAGGFVNANLTTHAMVGKGIRINLAGSSADGFATVSLTVHDGTSETTSGSSYKFTGINLDFHNLRVVWLPGDGAYLYVDGVLRCSVTTGLPSGAQTGTCNCVGGIITSDGTGFEQLCVYMPWMIRL